MEKKTGIKTHHLLKWPRVSDAYIWEKTAAHRRYANLHVNKSKTFPLDHLIHSIPLCCTRSTCPSLIILYRCGTKFAWCLNYLIRKVRRLRWSLITEFVCLPALCRQLSFFSPFSDVSIAFCPFIIFVASVQLSPKSGTKNWCFSYAQINRQMCK